MLPYLCIQYTSLVERIFLFSLDLEKLQLGRFEIWAHCYSYNSKNLTYWKLKSMSQWGSNPQTPTGSASPKNFTLKTNFWGGESNWLGPVCKNVSPLTLKKRYKWSLISSTPLEAVNILNFFLSFHGSKIISYFAWRFVVICCTSHEPPMRHAKYQQLSFHSSWSKY